LRRVRVRVKAGAERMKGRWEGGKRASEEVEGGEFGQGGVVG
jgi:hypothetical protein